MLKNIVLFLIIILGLFGFNIDHSIQHKMPPLKQNTSCTQDCCASLLDRPAMTYTYYQNTGRFKGGSGRWAIDVHGYSGKNQGYNNPDYQCVSFTGPLPANTYKLVHCQNIMLKTLQKPCSFQLSPVDQSKMCGRDDFMIHGCQCCTPGDSLIPPNPGCSAGCVIINYQNRIKLRVGDTLIVQNYEPSVLIQ